MTQPGTYARNVVANFALTIDGPGRLTPGHSKSICSMFTRYST